MQSKSCQREISILQEPSDTSICLGTQVAARLAREGGLWSPIGQVGVGAGKSVLAKAGWCQSLVKVGSQTEALNKWRCGWPRGVKQRLRDP